MSLKVIHIFLILCSIALLGFFGVWARPHVWASGVSFALAALLAAYLVWFVGKLRRNHL